MRSSSDICPPRPCAGQAMTENGLYAIYAAEFLSCRSWLISFPGIAWKRPGRSQPAGVARTVLVRRVKFC